MVGQSVVYVVGTVTYTVTNLNDGGNSLINLLIPVDSLPEADWVEGSQPLRSVFSGPSHNPNAVYQVGAPFMVSDPALVVPPVAVNDTPTVFVGEPTVVNELANDDGVLPLNDASVTVGMSPAHGTAVPQADGTILYTLAVGYVGPDSFTYTVADIDGRVSNAATVSLTVIAPVPPVAQNVTVVLPQNQNYVFDSLANTTATLPATVDATSLQIITAPTHGTA